jgi:hypothetical protein
MKKIIILCVICLFFGMVFQPAFANDVSIGIEKQPSFDGAFYKTYGDGEGRYVQQTDDGGYILVGDKNEQYLWLIKTDNAGNKEWDKTFSSPLSDRHFGNCVQLTSDGGYIIVGYRYHSLSQDGGAWLIKTDKNGNKIWDRTYGSDYGYIGECVQLTDDGGYIIIGSIYNDVWLVKVNDTGIKEWDKSFGGSKNDNGFYGQQTSDGGYIIVGETFSYGAGWYDGWLIKTDNLGNKEWDRTIGGSKQDHTYCVQQTNDGGYIITGVTESFGAGEDDVYLVKTDSDGNKIWDKTFGKKGVWETGYCVRQTPDMGYIITGEIFNWNIWDVYLIKTDSDGNKEWENSIVGGASKGYCVQQTTDGGYAIAGVKSFRVLLVKTNKVGDVRNKAVTVNMLLLRLLERFPLLQGLSNLWRLNVI